MEFKKIDPGVWKPKEAEEAIEGVLISIDEDSGKFNSMIYHIENDKGEQIVVFGSTILNDRMKYIKEGDYLKIVYKGITKNSNKQDVKLYDVYKGETTPKGQG